MTQKSEFMRLRIEPKTHRQIGLLADGIGVTRSQVARTALERGLTLFAEDPFQEPVLGMDVKPLPEPEPNASKEVA